MPQKHRGQSMLEYTGIIIIVIAVIIGGGPFVVNSVKAYFRMNFQAVNESKNEDTHLEGGAPETLKEYRLELLQDPKIPTYVEPNFPDIIFNDKIYGALIPDNHHHGGVEEEPPFTDTATLLEKFAICTEGLDQNACLKDLWLKETGFVPSDDAQLTNYEVLEECIKTSCQNSEES